MPNRNPRHVHCWRHITVPTPRNVQWHSLVTAITNPLPLLLLVLLLWPAALIDVSHAVTDIPIAKKYRAFGPLPTGTRGGNPLLSLQRPLIDSLLTLNSFPSECATGGYATWRDIEYNASANGVITAPFPDAELPYEAYALANFTVHTAAKHPHLLKCDRSALIRANRLHGQYASLLDDNPAMAETHCTPDYEDDGRSLCALRLYPGEYSIMVYLSSRSNETEFSCNYFNDPEHQPDTLLLSINDTVVPSIVVERTPDALVARLAGAHCSVTVMNIHDVSWAKAGSARLLTTTPGLTLAPQSTSDEHYPLPRIAPRQVRQLRLDLQADATLLHTSDAQHALPPALDVAIAVSYEFEQGATYETVFNLSLDVATWRQSRSYHFTYLDVDGSVQAAAVLPPRHSCADNAPTAAGGSGGGGSGDACTVLLSTHGAGVNAVGRAWTESYKTQNRSWVLLPTGRRKYGLNWEGPQMRSAVSALHALGEFLPGVPPAHAAAWRVRTDAWLQAGHSMGGHGALLLATHFPDMLVGALPAMGWLRLATYGEMAETEDLSYSDAALRALLTVSSAEYSADLYVENLLGIPFLARVGSADMNVPPSNLRKFCRLLKENEIFHNMTSSVALSEVEGEGHWFDGVVDDDILQAFIEKHLMATRKPALPTKFSVMTMNPSSTGSRGGLRILSLEVVFEISRLRVTRDSPDAGLWEIDTENVRRFRYEPVRGIDERPAQLAIDGNRALGVDVQTLAKNGNFVDFCALPHSEWSTMPEADTRSVVWNICADTRTFGKERSGERGPDNYGPGWRVLSRRKVAIVYPEGDALLQAFAIRYSNALYMRGISAMVTTDSNVTVGQMSSDERTNVILLGGPNMNRMARQHHDDAGNTGEVRFDGDAFCVGRLACYAASGTGIAFLSGGPGRTLVFQAAGTDRDGLQAALDFLPESPASLVAEWTVVSRARGWGFRGLGGVLALGYWDHHWKVERRKSYPAAFGDQKAVRGGGTCDIRGFGLGLGLMTGGWGVAWVGVLGVLALVVGLVAFVWWGRRPQYTAVRGDDADVADGSGKGSELAGRDEGHEREELLEE